jgi:large exoprotein involved in heme utilization and adhesion
VSEVGDPSGIKAGVQPGANGNGGILDIRANTIRVINGGQISVANEGTGQAGDMMINTRSLDVSGTSRDNLMPSRIPSRIAATANSSLPAGSISITADTINLRDQAIIAVSSLGSGDAGNLTITANSLKLDRSSLQSEVKGGSKGNIDLAISQAITLRNNSSISTNASSSANGGNIKINTPILLGNNNSDIVANAAKGQGGNINIITQGIFGLKPRPQITPANDITASSELGLNGTVEVNNIGVDPNSGLTELPLDLIDASQQITTGCNSNQGASFVITGRGGVPSNPVQNLNTDRPWQDARNIPKNTNITTTTPLIEATTWQLNPQGQPQLVAGEPIGPISTHITCAQ